MRAAHDQRQVGRHGRGPCLLAPSLPGASSPSPAARAGWCDLLGRACEAASSASSDVTRSWPLGKPGRIGASTLSRTICQLAPTATTRCPPRSTQSTSGSAAQGIECRHHLAVVGIEHDGPRRVIAVPSARERAGLGVDPRGHDLVDADVVGTPGGDLEAGQVHHRFNTLRAAEGENQVLVRHDRLRSLRHRGVLRGTTDAPAVRVEQPDRDLGLARAGANVGGEPLALVCSHLDRPCDTPSAFRRRRRPAPP